MMNRKRRDGYPEPIREMLAYTTKLQRKEAYSNLIEKLLDCDEGQEEEILKMHPALINEGFLEILEQRVSFWEEKEMSEIADYLRNISKIASEMINS
ncbi:MAG: hypothetical protein WA919_14635 [Coleofasciculaceae cyanobacterium]